MENTEKPPRSSEASSDSELLGGLEGNIYLIGFMGAGKSYIGHKLALELGRPFADLDTWIETTAGQPIKKIFEQHGESTFRQMEADHLRKSKPHQHLVVATGGGTPCFHSNMEWMLSHGRVVFLDPPIETLMRRLESERAHRPLLGLDFRRSVTQRLAERRPIYQKAHLIVDGDNDEQAILRLIQKSLD
ncbi:MAG: shikimate kinase [Bacteroidota bacterium]